MCKIIYDEKVHELPIYWNIVYITIRTGYEGRHIIANDSLLHGR